MSFDGNLQALINGWAGSNHLLDGIMVFFAQYSPEVLALVLLWVYFAPGAGRRDRRRVAIYATLAAAAALAVNVIIGHVWFRARPFVVAPATVHLLVHHANDASFPSDHATLAFAVAVGLWSLSAAWGWGLLLLGVVVCFARVFVGVHWPTDVIAGAVLGTLAALAFRSLAPRLDRPLDGVLDALGPLGRDGRPGRASGTRSLTAGARRGAVARGQGRGRDRIAGRNPGRGRGKGRRPGASRRRGASPRRGRA